MECLINIKTIFTEQKTFICKTNIKLGEFIEKAKNKIDENKNDCDYIGFNIIILDCNRSINLLEPNIKLNKPLSDYTKNKSELNIYFIKNTPYDLYWKYLLYKQGRYIYPPKYINSEDPINLEPFNNIFFNIDNDINGDSNAPPNVILIQVKKYIYAYNKKLLGDWLGGISEDSKNILFKNSNNLPKLPICNHQLTFHQYRNLLIKIMNSIKVDYRYRDPYTFFKIS